MEGVAKYMEIYRTACTNVCMNFEFFCAVERSIIFIPQTTQMH